MVSLRFLVSGLKSSWVSVGMDGFGKLRACLCFWLFFHGFGFPFLAYQMFARKIVSFLNSNWL
jgi:hypothetical protein